MREIYLLKKSQLVVGAAPLGSAAPALSAAARVGPLLCGWAVRRHHAEGSEPRRAPCVGAALCSSRSRHLRRGAVRAGTYGVQQRPSEPASSGRMLFGQQAALAGGVLLLLAAAASVYIIAFGMAGPAYQAEAAPAGLGGAAAALSPLNLSFVDAASMLDVGSRLKGGPPRSAAPDVSSLLLQAGIDPLVRREAPPRPRALVPRTVARERGSIIDFLTETRPGPHREPLYPAGACWQLYWRLDDANLAVQRLDDALGAPPEQPPRAGEFPQEKAEERRQVLLLKARRGQGAEDL